MLNLYANNACASALQSKDADLLMAGLPSCGLCRT